MSKPEGQPDSTSGDSSHDTPLRPGRGAGAPGERGERGERSERGPRGTRGTRGERSERSQGAESQKLHKVLAQAGTGSRRAMETWITEGRVKVNGKLAAIGMRVSAGDRIEVDGRAVRIEQNDAPARVLIYHKPEGEIVSRDDPMGRETVFTRLPRLRGARWISIGRLDVATSGLLIFTTSGELANAMMHPRFEVEREYAVRILGRLNEEQFAKLTQGVELEDGVAKCEQAADEGGEGSNHWYRIVLTEGRNRVVRRLFEALGFTVSRLMRVRFGVVILPPRLKRGQIEEFEPEQVKQLQTWLVKSNSSNRGNVGSRGDVQPHAKAPHRGKQGRDRKATHRSV